MDVFAATLHIDQVLARYDRQVINGEYTVVHFFLDDVSLGGSFD